MTKSEKLTEELHIVMYTRRRSGFVLVDPVAIHERMKEALEDALRREANELDPDVKFAVRTVRYIPRPR